MIYLAYYFNFEKKENYLRIMIHDIKNTDKRSLHLENNNITSIIDSISEEKVAQEMID